jgi:hypothetical protein
VLLALAALVLAYEEIQWRLAAVYALLGRLPLLRRVEAWVRQLPPYGALALFLVPSAILFPVKLLAFYWMAAGQKALGVATILAAKFAGTALVARIFQLTQARLLEIAGCRWVYERLKALRAAAYEVWRSLAIVRWWRQWWRRWWRRLRSS